MKRFGLRWALLAALVAAAAAQADVMLPKVFGSHMVLQRDAKLPFWGWADAGEQVSVKPGDGAAVTATTGRDGKWKLELPPAAAGGPFTVVVQGNNTITLDDVLVGEVWLCSGQSNMQMVVASCINWDAEKAAGDHPQIRQLGVPLVPAPFPTDDLPGAPKWTVCTPDTVGGFTACGYFMARELEKQLKVPIGLLNSSWGGTLIEPWIPPVGYAAVPETKAWLDRVLLADPHTESYKTTLGNYLTKLDAWTAKAKAALAAEGVLDPAPAYPGGLRPITDQVEQNKQQQPTALYNDMIHPLIPYAMRGAIWYQGESNRWDGMLYAAKMQALIRGWRQLWAQGDFPFYYVQIAPFHYGDQPPTKLPEFWEAQAALLGREPNTGEVVTNDIGELPDIHPKNKQEVGRRLALLALRNTYGRNDVVCQGPTYKSMTIEGGKVRLEFDNVGSGLASRDGKPLDWFRIIGTDTGWLDATAEIDGNAVVVSAPDVKQAAAVTFAWTELAMPNLMNKEGLPARPFRCGEVPDTLTAKAPESKGYALVYDLDLAKLGANPAYDVDHHT
ncbi:MAG: 9-O-acetylesterase, partial [Armatimonadetes bacterium]|nr:9-O-acetylesterase [Armatimonadota bacterium]